MSETPLAWFNIAHAYLHDAAILNAAIGRQKGRHYDAPVRYLYFHCIELFLKAFLRLHQFDEVKLSRKPYSHSLDALADEAERCGLLLHPRLRAICDAAANFDDPLSTRYIKTGPVLQFPPNRLHEAARGLQTSVEQALKAAGIAMLPLPKLTVVHPRRLSTLRQVLKFERKQRSGPRSTCEP